MATKRAKVGQILEVSTPQGLAYVQYTSKDAEYGHLIRVLPGFFETRPKDVAALAGRHGYFTFYPVGAALAQGLVAVAGTAAVPPGMERPSKMRRRGAISREGRVLTWIVSEGDKEFLRRELSAEEKQLSIAAIWNHEYLIQRICQGWRPEQET